MKTNKNESNITKGGKKGKWEKREEEESKKDINMYVI